MTIFDNTTETRAFEGQSLCFDAIAEDRFSDCTNAIKVRVADSSQWESISTTSANKNTVNVTTVGVFRNGNSNVGHVLGDVIWPIFQILETYNQDVFDFQIAVTVPGIIPANSVNRGPPDYLFEFASKYPLLTGTVRTVDSIYYTPYIEKFLFRQCILYCLLYYAFMDVYINTI